MTSSQRQPSLAIVVDADRRRAAALAGALAPVRVAGAISLHDAFCLVEERRPELVLLSAGAAREPGLPMFVQLLEMVGARLVAYGAAPPDGLPQRAGWVALAPGADAGADAGAVAAVLSRPAPPRVPAATRRAGPALVAIGASTGGIAAIEAVLAGFSAECPPTMIVQHIRPGFIASTIARLERVCAPRVVAAADGEPLARGTVYMAASEGCHLTLGAEDPPCCRVRPAQDGGQHRPSVDSLFDSVARLGPRASAALLTGMGADGAQGLLRIRRAGGFTIAQDRATSTVHGMPRVAAEIGAAAAVLPLGAIAAALLAGSAGAAGAAGRVAAGRAP